ncbi:OmpA family protein [Actinotalea sp. Marseille-Q4924]|uniref:OmpA family protein n=1 Tax=Actinotalea sp. Marseille-Q4924 TaxID=2866571 RepID=UPI001CE46E83|nr:OmpA family protein [Actinotalea sp. Marseille-Q4924]
MNDFFSPGSDDEAVAWLTEQEAAPSATRTLSTEAAVAALEAVPPLLEALPVLLSALGTRPAQGWEAAGAWESGEALEEAGDAPESSAEMWEYLEPGWDGGAEPEAGFIALAGVLIPAAELGLGLFQTLQQHALSGAFSVTSTAASYIHNPSPTGLTIQRRTFRFPITAHHPRYGIGTQTFWFDVELEYDGFNIRRVSVTEDRGSSSTLVSSDFTITFTPSWRSANNEPVAAISYTISGRWDPIGRGDESFRGSFVIDAAGNLTGLQVTSSQGWVRSGQVTHRGGGPVPRPTRAVHVTTVHFDPAGSATLTQDKIRHVHGWYTRLPAAVQAEVRRGTQPIRLTGRASTTGTVQHNQALARRRAEAVERILRDLAGPSAQLTVLVHGELEARTADSQETPDERRVDLECEYQVYQL